MFSVVPVVVVGIADNVSTAATVTAAYFLRLISLFVSSFKHFVRLFHCVYLRQHNRSLDIIIIIIIVVNSPSPSPNIFYVLRFFLWGAQR